MNTLNHNHRRYLFRIGAVVLLSSLVIISLNYYSIKILSSIRAYVNGESQYSKAQKDATRFLIDYIQDGDVNSYKQFKAELLVPIGDSLARVALQRSADKELIVKAALQGRNHPDDIDNLIWLFENFKSFPYFTEVVDRWTAGDRDIGELDRIGDFIYNLKNNSLPPSVKNALILKVNTINRRLSFNQESFSQILGEASRVIANWLLLINICFVLLILFSVALFARKAFNQIEHSKKLIIDQNNAKDEFMSIASHELKTPLTSMKASLQILERFAKSMPENKQMHPFIFNANKQVNRLTEMVRDLLDVTRIQSGKLTITRKPFLLNDLVKDVIEETTQTSKHNYIIKDFPPVYVNADAARIYQVIDNFLSNAAKYSANADEVHLWLEIADSTVKVCVRDFGPGIPKIKLHYLFDRFYRIEETRQTVQGLGLGLYICKEIVESHGGKVGADSDVGAGSTFWFSLPMLKVLNDSNSPDLRKDESVTKIEPTDADLTT